MDREREFQSFIVLNATQKIQDNITTYYHYYRCRMANLSQLEVYLHTNLLEAFFFFFFNTRGIGWESNRPANSCKHIRDAGDSRGDGEYWIDPENKGSPLKVYCDMTTDGGERQMYFEALFSSC